MKTIVVVYSNTEKLSKAEIGKMKKYSFNTDADIKVGDLLDSPTYTTKMLVVKVLNKQYKYYNTSTGKLSNSYNSTSQWEIRTLVIREDDNEVIYACKIKKDKE